MSPLFLISNFIIANTIRNNGLTVRAIFHYSCATIAAIPAQSNRREHFNLITRKTLFFCRLRGALIARATKSINPRKSEFNN